MPRRVRHSASRTCHRERSGRLTTPISGAALSPPRADLKVPTPSGDLAHRCPAPLVRGMVDALQSRSLDCLRPGSEGRQVIGSSQTRADAQAKLGRARCATRRTIAYDAACSTGRSCGGPVAHVGIRAIRRDPGFDWSAVVFATAQDIPGNRFVQMIAADIAVSRLGPGALPRRAGSAGGPRRLREQRSAAARR